MLTDELPETSSTVAAPLASFVISGDSLSTPRTASKRKSDNSQLPIPAKIQRVIRNVRSTANTPAKTNSAQSYSQLAMGNFNPSQPATGERHVYLSGFKPETDVSSVMNHLTTLGLSDLNNIQCKKLVSERKKRQKLSFVSFKLTTPPRYLDVILNPLNWPPNCIVREFENKQTNFLNAPQTRKGPAKRNNNHNNNASNSNQLNRPPRRAQSFHYQPPLLYQNGPQFQIPPHNIPSFFQYQPLPQHMNRYFLPQMPPIYNNQMNCPQTMMY